MSTTQHARAYVHNEMYGMALRRDLLLRNQILEKKVSGFEPALANMRKEVWDAKSKAATYLDEKQRAEIKLSEVVKERNVLAAQESKAVSDLGAERERSAGFHRELTELRASNALLVKERDEAILARDRMTADCSRLRSAIPSIFYKAIASAAVMEPFNKLLEAAKKMQQLETILDVAGVFKEVPDELMVGVIENAHDRYDAARRVLKELKVPYVDNIGSSSDASVDDILAMEP